MSYNFVERHACPACGSVDIAALWDSGFDHPSILSFVQPYYRIDPRDLKGRYRVDECRSCGLVFQAFVGDGDTLSALYSSWAPTAERADEIETYVADMKHINGSRDAHEIMAASAYLRMPPCRMKVLDYGMGWGLWPSIARKLGCEAYGTEFSAKMIQNANANGVRIIADSEIEEHRFNFINLEQVLEHVTEPLALLCRLRNSLAPGGIVKLSLPNASRAKHIIDLIASGRFQGDYETIMPIQPLEHINSFSPSAMKAMVKAAKLRCVRPSITTRYAFLWRGGLPRTAARMVKELVRPVWQYHNRTNIYAWLVRD